MNERIIEISGYTQEELLALPPGSLYADPADRARMVAELLRTEAVHDMELPSRRKDGSTYWISLTAHLQRDTSGAPTSILGIVDDVTARKRAEQALRDERDFSRNLVETANTLVVGLDLEGRVTIFNHAAERATGYTRAEVEGRNWFELATPQDRYPEVWREFERLLAGGRPRTFENPILTKAGEERYITWQNGEVVRDGRLVGTISFGMDLTERRQLEAQLRQSQKLEAIGSVAGMVAHDLNNLLTPILGYAEILGLDERLDPTHRADVEGIIGAANRARELVGQLLAFGRKQRVETRSEDLNDVVGGFAALLRRTLRDDTNLRLELSPLPLYIRGDRGQLEQVLMNLVLNAQDALPDGGTVTVSTRAVHLGEPSGVTPGPYARLVVADDGTGMDEATQTRAFEPFFTTKAKGRGTGLGLSTVYGIVSQHGGRTRITSQRGAGTTITIDLPRYDARPSEAAPRAPRVETARGETVLLAEDEPAVRAATEAMLMSLGYHVVGGTGEAAIAAAAAQDAIDLLVTDVVMPGMSGPVLAERVRARHPGLPVLFVSGYPGEVLEDPSALGHGTFYLQKPFSIADLSARVREALAVERSTIR